MTDVDLEGLLRDRLRVAHLDFSEAVIKGCAAYLALLRRWNARINLTALSLAEPLPASTADKLIIEPLTAAALVPSFSSNWVDLGSGGGSPAVPLRLTFTGGKLTLIEARERKCAFLREVARLVGLDRTVVENVRFEQFAPDSLVDLVTIRAVRLDESTSRLIANLLCSGGTLLCFGSPAADERLVKELGCNLPDGSTLFKYRRV